MGPLSWATAYIGFEGTHVDDHSGGAPEAATANSHGYWMTHGFGDSEGLIAGIAGQSFDDFFHLDDPQNRTWFDASGVNKGNFVGSALDDLSFEQAVAFGNGAGAGGDTTTPVISGPFEDLVREAATAVANYFDFGTAPGAVPGAAGTNSASFIDWYIYERNLDGTLGDNPTDAATVLTDLVEQVDGTLSGTGQYSVSEFAALLHLTHHA